MKLINFTANLRRFKKLYHFNSLYYGKIKREPEEIQDNYVNVTFNEINSYLGMITKLADKQ